MFLSDSLPTSRKRKRGDSGGNSTSLPAPVSVPPTQGFGGNDGLWSTFNLRIGRPDQDVSLLPSTAGSVIWAITSDGGCPDGTPVPPSVGNPGCSDSRGRLFNSNQSATYVPNSIYTLGVEGNLGLDSAGYFGYDDVTIGLSGSTGPYVQHQIIAAIADPRYWLGSFGLNPQPSNFTNFVSPQPSFMQSLRQTNQIPSISYGYTAGAYYMYNHVFGSLTIGGYDSTLFTPNNVSIPQSDDNTRDIVASVRNIKTNTTSNSLLPSGNIYAYVDSTIPWFYLPSDACIAFEQAFGLVYDPTWDLYLVNDSLHTSLLQTNPKVTFTIGSQPTGGNTVDISLPYAAFDHNVSYPWINATAPPYLNTARYFPLKRADNDTQYALGRAFLQEAYLVTDYENKNFSLSQRVWQEVPPPSNLVTINPWGYNPPKSSSSSSLSTGTIVGIVLGIASALVLLALLGFFIRRYNQMKKRAAAAQTAANQEPEDWYNSDRKSGHVEPPPRHPSRIMPETGGNERFEMPGPAPKKIGDLPNDSSEVVGTEVAREMHIEGSSGATWEADSAARFELAGSDAPLMMSEKLSGARLSGRDSDPLHPARPPGRDVGTPRSTRSQEWISH